MNTRTLGNRYISKIITKIKKSEYYLDEAITGGDLVTIVAERGIMFLRGLWHKLFLKKSSGHLFMGKAVKIQFGKKISLGKGVTIHNSCHINALCSKGIQIGNNFTLGEKSVIECSGVIRELGEGLIIGNNVGISANSFLGVRGMVRIGDNTIIGPFFSIHAENHGFEQTDTLIRLQPTIRQGITIGGNCWIGARVTILDGVTIGDGCVIAAGAVVNKDFPSNSIIGGVPARLLKKRLNT